MSRRILSTALALAATTLVLAAPTQASARAQPLSAPRSVTAVAGSASATVRWQTPSTGAARVRKYAVRRASSANGPWIIAVTVAATRRAATVRGLVNGTASYLDVVALDARGTGTASRAVKAVPFTVPSAPPSLTATPGESSVHLAWGAAAPHGSPVTAYVVRRLVDTTWTTIGATEDTWFDATALTNGTSSSFRVLAQNRAGNGPLSGIVTSTPRTHPAPPVGLTATRGDGSVQLAWSEPSGNGAAVTGYAIQELVGGTWTDLTTVAGTGYTATGLTNGTSYSFRVSAQNAVGTGAPATASATPLGLPDAPVLTDVSIVNGYIDLGWTQAGTGGSPIGHWNVERYADGAWTQLAAVTTAHHGFQVPVTPREQFALRLTASNEVGPGPASNEVTLSGEVTPDEPHLTSLTADGSGIHLAWGMPTDPAPFEQFFVTLQASPCSQSCFITQTVDPEWRTLDVTGLAPSTSYTVSIEAVVGGSTFSGGQYYSDSQISAQDSGVVSTP